MASSEKKRFTRRDMLKVSAGAGVVAFAGSGLEISRVFGASTSGGVYIEAFPTSPLVLSPFNDPLTIPRALPPVDPRSWHSLGGLPDPAKQDPLRPSPTADYKNKYGATLGTHQLWPGQGVTASYPWLSTTPLVYLIRLEVAGHDFTPSLVQPIDSFGRNSVPPLSGNSRSRKLPASTIYGFNGSRPELGLPATFPGPRINAEYGRPALVRFENHLDVSNGFDRQDFGAPNYSFLTHLHNGHTAPESDGNPHYAAYRFGPFGREEHRAAWEPGEWVDQLYLGYPAGGDDREKQSFLWFHDHVHGHTGANVYKGMVGLMPVYDPRIDKGDETDPTGLRLPGRRTDHLDGTFDVDYDIPMALYDCRLDDGVTPHQDAHNGSGETHPEWWGKTFFRHFPNHGFVGDVFTVNGTAYPVLEVKQRKYRLRFLDASVSRIYDLRFMRSDGGAKPARSLGYTGDELQGQYRLPDGQQCLRLMQIANEGGLLPKPIPRDTFELWPAKRREFVVDFGHYMDGKETTPGDGIWLVNTMKMTTGRMWDPADPAYKVPIMKIIIGGPPAEKDVSVMPTTTTLLRAVPDLVAGA